MTRVSFARASFAGKDFRARSCTRVFRAYTIGSVDGRKTRAQHTLRGRP